MAGDDGFDAAMRASAHVWREDGYENTVLGMGGSRDPSVYTTYAMRATLQDPTLEALYVQDHFAARIVEALPAYVLRAGWQLSVPGDPKDTAAIRKAYQTREEELGVVEALAHGAWWGRVFGGAITWVGAEDGRAPSEPVDEGAIASVRFLHTFDRRDVVIHDYYDEPRHPQFRRPRTYQVIPRIVAGLAGLSTLGTTAGGVLIHESRVVVWPGQPTTDSRRQELQGWDDSIFERCWEPLRQLGEDYAGKSLLLGRVSQGVIKIHDLYGKIADKTGNANLSTRMALLDASRSRARLLALDAREDYVNVTQPLAGVTDMIGSSVLRLASASGTPVTVLMGDSPSGQDATGESDSENWEAQGRAWQQLVLRPRHEKVARLLLLAKDGPASGREPEQWAITYHPLREAPPEKRAAVRKVEAETDAINIDRGVYTAEAAAFRYGPDGAAGVALDPEELRERAQRRRELAQQPPKDNAELGTIGPRSEAIASLLERVAKGALHRESAKALLVELYRFTEEVAERILGPADFRAAAPSAPKPPGLPRPPGPGPSPRLGQGAGTPPNLPGFNEGGDPR